MEENKQEYKRGKKDTYTLRMIIAVMVLLVLSLSELYIMINIPENYVALIVLTVVGLADIYVLIASWIQKNYKLEMQHQEQYDDLFKSEKASYLIIRKSFDEMNERLDRIEDTIGIPTEEIINAQKAIAKVTINRNKENSDALMNSNDKMLDIMFGLEDKIDTTNADMLEKQRIVIENAMKDMIMKQQEIISSLREAELSIRNELLSEINKINTSSPQIVMSPQMYAQPAPNAAASETPAASVSGSVMDEEMQDLPIDENFPLREESLSPEEDSLSSDDGFLSDEDFAKMAAELQEITSAELKDNEAPADEVTDISEENIPSEPAVDDALAEESAPAIEIITPEPAAEEPAPAVELNSDPNHMMTPEEIAALVAGTAGNSEPAAEAAPAPEPVMEEPASAVEPNSDPNHMMTPEEIAALIAGTTSEVEEPVIETQPIEEEPAAGDLLTEEPVLDAADTGSSDPNRKMTPEEIAALFANI